jgi:hypothetical protein
MFVWNRTVATGFLPVPAIAGLMLAFATGFGMTAPSRLWPIRRPRRRVVYSIFYLPQPNYA